MKTIKTFKLAFIALIGLGTVACSGESEEETTEENTEETSTEEVVEEEIVEEENTQIVMDLDNETFQQMIDEKTNAYLLDVRTAEEFEGGAIEGAVNVDFNSGAFEAAMDTLDPERPVLVYCQGGGRSGKARDMLKENNFAEIYNLSNGYGNWE